MHFCFFAQFVEFSLNIANICAAAARGCVQLCGLGVWRLQTIARDISMEQGCNYSGQHISPAKVKISAEFT